MRLLRRNLLSTYAVYGASVVSGLVVTPIIVHALGKEGYGVWAFIASVTVFLGLLDLGVGPSVVRFSAVARGRGRMDETSALASAALALYGAIALVTVPAGLALAWFVPAAVGVERDLVWAARIAALLVVAGIVARFPLGLALSLLIGQQRFDLVNAANLLSIVTYTALVVALMRGDGGIVLLAVLALAATLLRLLLPAAWLRRELHGLRLRRALVTRARLRELTSFSSDNFLIQLAARVVFSTDVIVVGVVLGAAAAAVYAIPAKLFALAAGAGAAGPNLLYPAFAELEGREDPERQRRLLLAGLRAAVAAIVVLALPLAFVPDQILRGWIGPGFDDAVPVAILLAAVLILHQPTHVLSQYLVARARQRAVARLSTAIVAVNLALSIALAYAVGLWGVALATLVTEAVAVVVVPLLVARSGGPRLGSIALAAARPLVPALAAALLVLVLFARSFDADDVASLTVLALVWLAVSGPLIWRFGLAAEERRELGARFRGRAVAPVAAAPEVGP